MHLLQLVNAPVMFFLRKRCVIMTHLYWRDSRIAVVITTGKALADAPVLLAGLPGAAEGPSTTMK
jgi:hypothetical protein